MPASFVHSEKAWLPIEVTLPGINTERNSSQLIKAELPISVTGRPSISLGILIDDSSSLSSYPVMRTKLSSTVSYVIPLAVFPLTVAAKAVLMPTEQIPKVIKRINNINARRVVFLILWPPH